LFLVDNKSYLFVHHTTERDMVWNGRPYSLESLKEKYKVTQVYYTHDVLSFVNSLKNSITKIHVLKLYDVCKEFVINISCLPGNNEESLARKLDLARAIKNDKEIELISKVCLVSSEGHNMMMSESQPGIMEFQFESLFQYFCSWRGCRQMAYPSIVGSGPNSAILHYVHNNRMVNEKEFVLIDAGAEFLGYSSDITRTFPSDGKFTDDQKLIYGAVLKIQKILISDLKPGLLWIDITAKSNRLLLEELLQIGLVQNGTIDELYEQAVHRVFLPHGLGHHIGLDVHDSTIYPEGPLVPGMIVTIEPGLYFNQALIDNCMASEKKKYLNEQLVAKFYNSGGVRIEDDILITQDGHRVLTTTKKEIEDIEELMKS